LPQKSTSTQEECITSTRNGAGARRASGCLRLAVNGAGAGRTGRCLRLAVNGAGARRAGRCLRLAVVVALIAALPASAGALRYWIEPCPANSRACSPGDRQLAEWAFQAWRKVSGGKLTFESTSARERAQIRILWTGGREGLYGEARPITVDGIRGAEVYVLAPPVEEYAHDPLLRDTIVYLTCLHETGHALGLTHTAAFDDIMYSFQYGGDIEEYFARYRRQLTSRNDIPKHSGTSEADRRRLADLLR